MAAHIMHPSDAEIVKHVVGGQDTHQVLVDRLTAAHRVYGMLMTFVRGISSTLSPKETALLCHLSSSQQPKLFPFLPHTYSALHTSQECNQLTNLTRSPCVQPTS